MSRALVLVVLLLAAGPARAELLERSQWLMGTELRIGLVPDDHDPAELEALLRECFDLTARLERVLSRWDPEAELARLNASAGVETPVSEALFTWLQRCADDALRTGGAFDPTVGTWILRPDAQTPIGMDRLVLDPARRTVLLPAGMALDSGGDGKGVAVDAIVARLRAAEVEGIVNFGGSSCAGIGEGPGGEGWPLAVLDADGAWIGTVVLRDAALSISRSVQVDQLGDGETVHRPHIYDPATGALVREVRTSVVVADSATEAEVLSTALVVRGTGGLRFLDAYPGAEAVLTPVTDPVPSWWRPAPQD